MKRRRFIPGYTHIGDTSCCDVHVTLRVQDNRTGRIWRQGLRLMESNAKAPWLASLMGENWGHQIAGILVLRDVPKTTDEYIRIAEETK